MLIGQCADMLMLLTQGFATVLTRAITCIIINSREFSAWICSSALWQKAAW